MLLQINAETGGTKDGSQVRVSRRWFVVANFRRHAGEELCTRRKKYRTPTKQIVVVGEVKVFAGDGVSRGLFSGGTTDI